MYVEGGLFCNLTEEEILYVEGGLFWFIPAAVAAAKVAAPFAIAAGKFLGSAAASGAIGWGLGKLFG